MGWLESIVESLQSGSAESPQKQLASVVLIVYCIKKSSINIVDHCKERFVISLLKLLHLRSDPEKRQCPDYEYLCEVLPTPSRLVEVCKCIMMYKYHGLFSCTQEGDCSTNCCVVQLAYQAKATDNGVALGSTFVSLSERQL